ncbi:MAG: MG2 domain-containing protein, partial [Pseudomonadota bacterium]
LAENNDILARATSDADGFVTFNKEAIAGKGPLRPAMLLAYGPQSDFASLDLRRAPLDLADYQVAGREAPPIVDGYLYTDRGIYRAGETVHISGLLRDSSGRAENRPSTLVLTRPNGVEATRFRIDDYNAGGFSRSFTLPTSSPRGSWRASLEADATGRAATLRFSVEDFVPQRLEVTLNADVDEPLLEGDPRSINLSSRFLYGAPAANLAVEAEARIRVDPNPFPDYKSYSFKRVGSPFQERLIPMIGVRGAPKDAVTDENGNLSFDVSVPRQRNASSAPLRADIVVGVIEPGGRIVRDSIRIPYRDKERYVGLSLSDGKSSVGLNEEAIVEILSIDRHGIAKETELEWSLVREDYQFEWYRQNGQWRWRRTSRDVQVGDGTIKTNLDGKAFVTRSLDPGAYRLTAYDTEAGSSADLQFYVGWRSYESGVDRPDKAAITVVSDEVTPGGKVRLVLDAPYAGEATVVVATDTVQSTQRVRVEEGPKELVIDTDEAWGAGFYLLTSVVTPRTPTDRPVPRRAMGITYVPFNMQSRTLDVSITTPELVRPNTNLDLEVLVDNNEGREPVFLTVAAVDEGILRLTKHQSPDPRDHFFGKKRLAVEIRDDYGRVLNPNLGAPLRFGGDQIGGEGLTVVPTKTVALFNGQIELDERGRGVVPLQIPEFNGELRLMAVAWSERKLGSVAQALTVRERTPTLLSLPRFLAPGDKAKASLFLDNLEGDPGVYNVALKGRNSVLADDNVTRDLTNGEQLNQELQIEGGPTGIGQVDLVVTAPGGESNTRSLPIQSRSPFFPISRSSTTRLAAGDSLSLSPDLFSGFSENTVEAFVSFSPFKGVDPAPLIASLSEYPYGCSEQLVSVAMPLMYKNVLSQSVGADERDLSVRQRVQTAINTLLDRQDRDGSFGLWRVSDRAADPWIGAYITDFLTRASAEGFAVPDQSLERSFDALRQIADVDRYTAVAYRPRPYQGTWSNDTLEKYRHRAAAYAMYVLARAGEVDISDLRYFHDASIDKIESPLARAHLGAALATVGDRARAVNAFGKALQTLGYENTGDHYQSSLRDAAGVVSILAMIDGIPGIEEATETLEGLIKDPKRMKTKEKAFAVLAARS